jgi:pyocin large subunit-like protein
MRRFIILLLALSLTGCGKQNAGDALAKSTESWRATLKLVADARLAKKVGAGFAMNTAEATVEDLSKQVDDPSLPREQITRAAGVIGAARELGRAVSGDDTAGLAHARSALAATPAKSK